MGCQQKTLPLLVLTAHTRHTCWTHRVWIGHTDHVLDTLGRDETMWSAHLGRMDLSKCWALWVCIGHVLETLGVYEACVGHTGCVLDTLGEGRDHVIGTLGENRLFKAGLEQRWDHALVPAVPAEAPG